MTRVSERLISALRDTALRLADRSVTYRWSHFAHCNCGHLAQTITGLAPSEIQERALRRAGDWAQQAERVEVPESAPDYGDRPALDEGCFEPERPEFCAATGMPLDTVLRAMFELGLSREDVAHLERLSDPAIRRRLGTNLVDYPHNQRDNVVAYLHAWADLLEEQLEPVAPPLAQAAE